MLVCLSFLDLTAGSMKLAAFWVVASCRLVKLSDVLEVLAASISRTIALRQ
jgi:hypothetical protein